MFLNKSSAMCTLCSYSTLYIYINNDNKKSFNTNTNLIITHQFSFKYLRQDVVISVQQSPRILHAASHLQLGPFAPKQSPEVQQEVKPAAAQVPGGPTQTSLWSAQQSPKMLQNVSHMQSPSSPKHKEI